jgi:hypothetical protein
VVSDLAVVTNLHLVIDLHSITHYGIFDSPPIYRGARTHVDIISKTNSSDLGDWLQVTLCVRREPKSISAYYCTTMDHATSPNAHSVIQNRARHNDCIGPDHTPFSDIRTGPDLNAVGKDYF